GLVKDDRHKTSHILYGNPPEVVTLDRRSQPFYLVQRVQDEVHRFAISFHRHIRSKGLFQSELDQIPGVGEKRRNLLLRHFKSIKKIREATIPQITRLGIPKNVAETIHDHLNELDE